MTLEARIARAHRMDDAAWARHANPRSVWTRTPIPPALALVAWARVWIGWGALLPAALLLAWTWPNPRAFAPPANTDNWASHAVLGERLWLARRDHPVPAHHRTLPVVLNAMAGLAVAIGAKMWFLDRMVWLTHAMRDDPRLRGWMAPGRGVPPPSC